MFTAQLKMDFPDVEPRAYHVNSAWVTNAGPERQRSVSRVTWLSPDRDARGAGSPGPRSFHHRQSCVLHDTATSHRLRLLIVMNALCNVMGRGCLWNWRFLRYQKSCGEHYIQSHWHSAGFASASEHGILSSGTSVMDKRASQHPEIGPIADTMKHNGKVCSYNWGIQENIIFIFAWWIFFELLKSY